MCTAPIRKLAASTVLAFAMPAVAATVGAQTQAASALSGAFSATVNGTSTGMTCNGSTTLGSDGNTADTDGLISLIASAVALPGGAEVVLPTGHCEINKEIDIPVNASLRFMGAGTGLTDLEFFTPNGVGTPVGNGLVFTISNNANLTVDDFTISRRLGSNLGTTFIGTGISIGTSSTNPAAGTVTTTNLNIYPATDNAQTDSWNTGLLETNLTDPTIYNVNVSMPGWGNLPDPGGYNCSTPNATFPCAIHALPSPGNPVSTPANLAFGTAAGFALQGSGSGHFAIDASVGAVTVTGGLAAMDLRQFQGVYVTDSKFASDVYGIRADTPSTTSELLTVSNSLFTNTVGGIYSNGIGGLEIDGNYFDPADSEIGNLPGWTAIWSRNSNNVTISANNIVGDGNSSQPEYGIWQSADGWSDGFPSSITGNTIYSLSSPGSVCMGNDINIHTVNATGNSLLGCATFVSDATNGNGYGNNTFNYPDMYDSSNNGVVFPKSVTIGTFADPGSLTITGNGSQTFGVDSSGNVTAAGSLTAGGSISASGALTGSSVTSASTFVLAGYAGHNGAEEVVGGYGGSGGGTLALSPAQGGFPPLTGGYATVSGELTCTNLNQFSISWRFIGHYTSSGSSLVAKAFSATIESDGDSQWAEGFLTGTSTIVPALNPNVMGIEVQFGKGINSNWSCSSDIHDIVSD